jgi:hypothetical protein
LKLSVIYAIFPNMKATKPNRILRVRKKPAEEIRRIQELRRSNAATFVPSALEYKRKPKHVKRGYDESDTN